MSFSIKNCRISISYYFFAMCAALVLMCRDWLFLCGIAAAAVHELGHLIAIMCCRGCYVREIAIGALGIRITAVGALERPLIMLAGVIANIVFSMLCAPFMLADVGHSAVLPLIAADVCLAACNILPIEPLDGGSLLRWIAERRLSAEKSDRIIFIIALCTMIPLTAFGLFAVMQSRGNFSLLILCLWLLAGIIKRYL